MSKYSRTKRNGQKNLCDNDKLAENFEDILLLPLFVYKL